jgi:hypothetical protein
VESFAVVAASLCAWGPTLVDEYFIDWWKLIQQEADAPRLSASAPLSSGSAAVPAAAISFARSMARSVRCM